MILSPPPSYYLVLKIVSLIDVSFLKRKTFAWHIASTKNPPP